jgi:hemolysin activation/secretion protein
VSRIEVTRSTILTAAEIASITSPVEGRNATLEELQQVADRITQLYLDRGYITSRAVLVAQTVAPDGIVRIQVVEGSLERIDIEGARRTNFAYIRSRIELATKPPLSQQSLEDQLRLLKLDPLFDNVEASLRPGTNLGQSILTVRVTEAKPFNGLIGVDNYSPPRVGAVRLGGAVSYRNLTGFGDEITAAYFGTTAGGADIFDFGYRIPVNPMNGTVQLRIAPSSTRIVSGDFRALNITGDSSLYEISFRQPLVRSPREEFAVSLGFTIQDGQTFLDGFPINFGLGPDVDGNSKTRVLKFAQDYIKRDLKGAWALRSQFSFGLGILNATKNDDPIPDGRFVSWLGQIQRVQRLGFDHLLIVQLDAQFSSDSLLPSQQFVIGGGQSLRGFSQNIRSGDNGFRLSVEDRIAIQRNEAGVPTLQLAPFVDMGAVWNVSDNPNNPSLPEKRFLAAVGLGLLWQPLTGLNVRLDYAIPFVTLPDRGNDAQDEGFHFSVTYQF